jgi:hypothetical protein
MKRIVLLTLLLCSIISCTNELDGKTIIHIKRSNRGKPIVDTTKIAIDTTKTKQDSWKEIEIKN